MTERSKVHDWKSCAAPKGLPGVRIPLSPLVGCVIAHWFGEMAEWSKAAVSKTAVGENPTGGSNPPLSAFVWSDIA